VTKIIQRFAAALDLKTPAKKWKGNKNNKPEFTDQKVDKLDL
jgi:hypothetical protein